MKYFWWRYRSVLVTVAMVGAALFFTSTVVGILDRVMARKTPSAPAQAYEPPNNPPNLTRSPTADGRDATRPASEPGQLAVTKP
jgi:hypothetical protein